jgi:hypothetical protein
VPAAAAAALGPQQGGQRVDRGAEIGMWIEPAMACGADAAPLADQEGAAEQIGPDFHPGIAPFVQRRADADERGRFGKQHQLGRRRPGGGRQGGRNHDTTLALLPGGWQSVCRYHSTRFSDGLLERSEVHIVR